MLRNLGAAQTDLIDWKGSDSHAGYQNLLGRLQELLPRERTMLERGAYFVRQQAFAIGLLAFAILSSFLLLQLAASSREQISAQQRAAEQLQKSETSLASLIATTEKLLEPELRFTYVLSIGPQSSGHFSVENSGSGMATIKAIRASVDGRDILTDAASLSAVGGRYGLVGHTLKVDETIGPGRAVKLFDIPAKDVPGPLICRDDKDRKKFFERLQLEIAYMSLLGTAKTLKLQYKSPNTFNC